ncbi:MAG: hypothetical protein JRI68_10205 [Deltaproteobacteria bacterium]|nr:hypothetical protein [Deltaproteobacteria bacterium]
MSEPSPRAAARARLVAVVTLAGLVLATSSCCSTCVDILELAVEGAVEDEPDEDAPRVDLGTAEYPAGNGAEPVSHKWWVPRLDPEKYRLGYQVPRSDVQRIDTAYDDWARSVRHRRMNKDTFQWRPPPGCLGGLQCVYAELDKQGREAIEPLSDLFVRRLQEEKLSAMDVAALVVTFVQDIKYEIPKEQPFGVRPPALVVHEAKGDCDSKALLGHMILRRLGIHSVLISSQAHKHTMMGVALTAPGRTFTWQGRRYAFVETTAKRSPIGHIAPKLLRPNDWKVVKIDYDQVATPSDVRRKRGKDGKRSHPLRSGKSGKTSGRQAGGPIRID